MRASAWLGVDVGTSSLKVLAVDANGCPLAEQETALPLEWPTAHEAEADPRAWIRAVDEVVAPMSQAYDARCLNSVVRCHQRYPDYNRRPGLLRVFPDSLSRRLQSGRLLIDDHALLG